MTQPKNGRLRLAVAALALVLSACGQTAQPATPTRAPELAPPATSATSTAAPAPTATAVATGFDRDFIDMMVPHHEGALEMARIAQARAERAEIKNLARQILQGQQDEITQMRAWRQAWFGSSETPPMTTMPMLQTDTSMAGMGHTMDMSADVERLRSAPEPFDRAFLDAMIPHHQSAIDAARLARKQAVHLELQDLALGILEGQQLEVGEMMQWRQAWTFGDSPKPVPGGAERDVPDEHAMH